MASPEFSEFTYGYALTDSLLRAKYPRLKRAPIFPSLVAEGSSGGGYDLKIPAAPVPLFLQFKIPVVVTRRSSLIPPRFWPPYYRMPLRTRRPDQHSLLLDLEAREPLVFYATPLFHTVRDLDRDFSRTRVHQKTLFIPPSAIGPLNAESHYLAYEEQPSVVWCQSEPRSIEGWVIGEAFDERVVTRQRTRDRLPARDVLNATWHWFVERAVDPVLRREQRDVYDLPMDDMREQARRIAYLAQVRLGITFGLLDSAAFD